MQRAQIDSSDDRWKTKFDVGGCHSFCLLHDGKICFQAQPCERRHLTDLKSLGHSQVMCPNHTILNRPGGDHFHSSKKRVNYFFGKPVSIYPGRHSGIQGKIDQNVEKKPKKYPVPLALGHISGFLPPVSASD